jgi:hypothetical protein
VVAVKVRVPACIPAAVGSPRNHRAAPVNAGLLVIIGIGEDRPSLAVMTKPWAVPGSALTTSMLTLAPAGTTTVGLTMPPMRKVSSGPPAGLATAARCTLPVAKVMVRAARSMRAPGGVWVPSVVAWPGPVPRPGQAGASQRPATTS